METHDPGVLEGNHVVDIDVGGGLPGGAVKGRHPSARGGGAVGGLDDVDAITLQDGLADRQDACQLRATIARPKLNCHTGCCKRR